MITIKLKNAGLLENAEFDIGGLTVMAGLNNTGKTFISKTIFSLIKTVKDSEQYLRESKEEEFESLISRTERLSRMFGYSSLAQELWEKLREERFEIRRNLKNEKDNSQQILLVEEELYSEEHYLSKLIKILKEICEIHFSQVLPEHKERFSQQLISIEKFEKGLQENDSIENYRKCFNNFISTNFKRQFNNLFSDKASIIEVIDENKEEILSLSVENNKTNNIKINQDLSFPIKEINFLFSPIILQFFKFVSLTSSRRYLGLSSPGASYKKEYEISKSLGAINADLLSKLTLSAAETYSPEGKLSIIQERIRALIGGYLEYDGEKDFVYRFEKDGKEVSVPVSNTAEGIKAFGVLQLLLGVEGLIDTNSLLLFDEPEVHLHPEWQVELAKILVKMAEMNIPIFISSHSPYMLEAIFKYSKESTLLQDKLRIYYLEKNTDNNNSTLKDFTKEDTFPLFEKMSDAMSSLIKDIDD